ncbi:predicted protein [Plenodomus lingam JN3]|uniref:Predicted protein n=1 Tax=Leptosphaeria maculans (strain JN3 / isolate v23.1.3 / race Av1-4-5-6-7-8) TaxID=985895 RepID=E5A508_LEPMJ|nr:predicted protein [Plenodomus lingam JN3]CBX98706.1 predicted protein [Plenodomus lingam JN3]
MSHRLPLICSVIQRRTAWTFEYWNFYRIAIGPLLSILTFISVITLVGGSREIRFSADVSRLRHVGGRGAPPNRVNVLSNQPFLMDCVMETRWRRKVGEGAKDTTTAELQRAASDESPPDCRPGKFVAHLTCRLAAGRPLTPVSSGSDNYG